jgi:hypothetical protein
VEQEQTAFEKELKKAKVAVGEATAKQEERQQLLLELSGFDKPLSKTQTEA